MELKGFSSPVGYQGDGTVKFGYCPQENVLWPVLTVKEHLEVYAAVKGLKKKDASVAITRYVEKPFTPCLGGWHIINVVHTKLKRGLLARDHVFVGDLVTPNWRVNWEPSSLLLLSLTLSLERKVYRFFFSYGIGYWK